MSTSHEQLRAILDNLKLKPATLADAPWNRILPIYGYLMNVPPNQVDGSYHWFCDQADPLTVQAASFLLRLMASDNQYANLWRDRLKDIVSRCLKCVKGFTQAKLESQHTYLGAFTDGVLRSFYAGFLEWEIKVILENLRRLEIHNQSSPSNKNLKDAPAVVYHMLSSLDILKDTRMASLLPSHIPTSVFPGWFTEPPPPGLLMLQMHSDESIRTWARAQLLNSEVVPIPSDQFTTSYEIVLEEIVNIMTHLSNFTANISLLNLWTSFNSILRFIPIKSLTISIGRNAVTIKKVVLGHLHDVGTHMGQVLLSLLILLDSLGSTFWQDEQPEYPRIVFDAIKDSVSYCNLILENKFEGEQPWYLAWFAIYLHSIRHLPVYGEVLAKMVDFLCEELQHERFGDARPIVMGVAARLLSSVLKSGAMKQHFQAFNSTVDIHAHKLVAAAFARPNRNMEYGSFPSSDGDARLKKSRSAARDLIKQLLIIDIDAIRHTVPRLCITSERGGIVTVPSLRKAVWMEVFQTIDPTDHDGVAIVLAAVARVAHLDTLTKEAFTPIWQPLIQAKDPNAAVLEPALDAVNQAIPILRQGFRHVTLRFADCALSSDILDLMRNREVGSNIVLLMLSPMEDYSVAAQALVRQAFDIDLRIECFRALLENLPRNTFEGIIEFLETFIKHAHRIPEVCSLSKSLVRCFTDIIEVLCAGQDGLLHNRKRFISPNKTLYATVLPIWWDLMTKAITVIFKKTPSWAKYFSKEDMVLWMRDALIFGRELLAQRRVIEAAIVFSSGMQTLSEDAKSMELSAGGRQMVSALQDVLLELARWLRLTDEELLHQAFALLESLLECFRESNVSPSKAIIAKLTKHIDGARRQDSELRVTLLDSTRLLTLEHAIAPFIEDDDEIQFLSYTSNLQSQAVSNTDLEVSRRTTGSTSANRQISKDVLAQTTLLDRFKPPFRKTVEKLDGPSQLPVATTTSVKKNGVPVADLNKRLSARSGSATSRATPSSPSASEDSESEGEEQHEGLSALARLQRTPKIKRHVERRQIKILDLPSKARDSANERLARQTALRQTALRLRPDVSSLHRAVLSWNYEHQGPVPPSFQASTLTHIPDRFSDSQHYRRVFEPLIRLECWSQISQSKDESQETYSAKISSRLFVDDWLEVDVSITEGVKKDWFLSDSDIVVLRHLDGKRNRLGKVQSYKAHKHSATSKVIQATIRFYSRDSSEDPGLEINTIWNLSKVFSLTTIHREYAALMALPCYELLEDILHPRLREKPTIPLNRVEHAMTKFKVNKPQAVAILSALQTPGFSLIQGPPGTGKTTTVCGLVEAYLSNRPRIPTSISVGRNAPVAVKEITQKILLCAPSNAAIDEVCHRIHNFRQGVDAIKVVRVGTDKNMNTSIKDISLDYLVDQRLESSNPTLAHKDLSKEIELLRGELGSLKQFKLDKQAELQALQDNGSRVSVLEHEIKQLNLKRMGLIQKLDHLKDTMKSDFRTLDATRRKFRDEVLREADVICTTLSGAGHELLESFEFEMVIIDEAAQAIELSSLIPLRYRCRNCVLIGDPQQLPPTVLSQEACRFGYDQSLYVRLQKFQPEAVHLLSIQYRMHPDISKLPSLLFYQGHIQDGPDMALKTQRPWHMNNTYGIYRFFNVPQGREEKAGRQSLKNVAECHLALTLYSSLRRDFPSLNFSVGVVSMYKAQVQELRRSFETRFGREIKVDVDFNTVDGFQGQEKDIIILSCVRAGPGLQTIGFLKDFRRMNVALTRAKSSLFILGHIPTLERCDENWRKMIQDSRSRQLIIDLDRSYFTNKASPPQPPKAEKSTPSMPPIPDDLMTPSAFKSSLKQVTSEPLAKNANNSGQEVPPDHDGEAPPTGVGQKRPLLNSKPLDDAHESGSARQKIARLAVKRRQPTIFIPKVNKGLSKGPP